ncbi:MAG: flagellar biosynthetic protein FliR [Acidobacteria bacterium]|nr:flagellar biosynthetic protein FliR [Acidobacteriota bacterium]MBI3471947.1 flagellar biosynthetic protein FliR [Candidatus Solibacter usitatus]
MGLLDALSKILSTIGIKTDVMMFLVMFGLAFARSVTAISLAPFVGGNAVPGRIKVGMAALVTMLIYPHITLNAPRELPAVMLVGLIVKEAIIGATIGMLTQLVFYSVQMAGIIVDTQRGMNQLTFFSPQLPGPTSALGQFQFQAALVLFLAMNGHLHFIQALSRSFVVLPLMTFPHFHGGIMPVMEMMIRLTGDGMVIALQLGAPVLVALFLVDIAFGALGKVAGRINVHNESQPVKSLVGLIVFILSAALILGQLQKYFVDMLLAIDRLTKGIA